MFVYVQMVTGPVGANTFEAGLADVVQRKLRGAYGYDQDEQKPQLAGDYLVPGVPWTVVIDRQGVVRHSRPTEITAARAAVEQARRGS